MIIDVHIYFFLFEDSNPCSKSNVKKELTTTFVGLIFPNICKICLEGSFTVCVRLFPDKNKPLKITIT